MARLYDRIMAGDEIHGPDDGGRALRAAMPAITVIQADNVAAYYQATKASYRGADGDVWEMGDFPNIAPPLSPMWIEFRSTFDRLRVEVAVIIEATEVGEGVVRTRDWVPGAPTLGSHHMEIPFPNGGWMVRASILEREGRDRPVVAVGDWVYGVHADGAPWTTASGSTFTIPVAKEAYREAFRETVPDDDVFAGRVLTNWTRIGLYPALLAISFMHCKNVERRPIEQPPKLSKKWQKKHGRPLVRYHVLDIDPMRKVLKDEGKSEETGLKKALHICRGHFATYTEDAPLFGKVTGTFWKPQHIRGSKKQGLVIKDYNVKSPGPDESA